MLAKEVVIHTVPMPNRIMERLGLSYKLSYAPLREIGVNAFVEAIGDARVIICAPGDAIDEALIRSLPGTIELLASYSTGLDHIDLNAAKAKGCQVSNTPDVLTDATADIALLLMLGAVRGAHQSQQILYKGTWPSWTPMGIYGADMMGRVLGIVGAGRIGVATAQRAKAFGLSLKYWSNNASSGMEELGAERCTDFTTFLGAVDIVSLHVPLSPKTENLIDKDAIEAMRDGAVLINTARGDIICEQAVISALETGKLRAAGLDVFRNEPRLDPRWLRLNNVFILPHIGSATEETRERMGHMVADSIDAFFGVGR